MTVKKRNLFSQITDSRFYEGEPIQTWYVTNSIEMTNSSQSYTTTVNYEGQIDTSSTRYGPNGIEYYEYVTTTNGIVTATVHPYEYVSTTSQKVVEVVKAFFNWLAFLLTGGGDLAGEMVSAGVLDFSGQGRDKYGR